MEDRVGLRGDNLRYETAVCKKLFEKINKRGMIGSTCLVEIKGRGVLVLFGGKLSLDQNSLK